jgi:hypothetical protein
MLESQVVVILEKAGLLVASVGSVGSFANGYSIAKPKSTLGNTRRDYECFFGSEEIPCNAPVANLYPKEGKWIFEVLEWVQVLALVTSSAHLSQLMKLYLLSSNTTLAIHHK